MTKQGSTPDSAWEISWRPRRAWHTRPACAFSACPTGVCGPSVDPELVRFNADLDWLSGQGVGIERFNLAQQPQAFAANPQVADFLGKAGVAALPLVLCEGKVLTTGSYPTREALATAAGLPTHIAAEPAAPPAHPRLSVFRPKCEPGSGCC